MTATNKIIGNSIVYERIAEIRMSPGERVSAVEAMQDGERIAAAILNVAHLLRLLVATPYLKPSFKY